MSNKHSQHLLFPLIASCLILLLAACGSGPTGSTSLTGSTPTSGRTSVATPGSAPTPTPTSAPTSTTCPAAGSGRPALTPPLRLGASQQIVYYHNIANQMVLDLFDVQRHAVVAITSQNEHIQTAQISGDGQWVLMVVNLNSISELQLVRLDGKYMQTLYCAPAGQQIDPTQSTGAQWSPDQKQIIFVQGPADGKPHPLYLLNLASGAVQLELTPGSNHYVDPTIDYLPITWIDNARLYLVDQPSFVSLSILDTRKGPNQHASDLQGLIEGHQFQADLDSSYDASKLFVTQLNEAYDIDKKAPSIFCFIGVMPVNRADFTHNISCKNLQVLSLRVIGYSSSSLMLGVNGDIQNANDGYWKINIDGTGLTQLNTQPAWFNKFTQYPWSNFSRNGSFYTDGLFYGSLHGGPLTRYASDGEGDGNILVGWTLNPIAP